MRTISNIVIFIQGLLLGMKLMGAGMSWGTTLSPTIISLYLLIGYVTYITEWDDEQT